MQNQLHHLALLILFLGPTTKTLNQKFSAVQYIMILYEPAVPYKYDAMLIVETQACRLGENFYHRLGFSTVKASFTLSLRIDQM